MNTLPLIRPNWPAPACVKSAITTRTGGVSVPPWDSFNLGSHVGDNSEAVAANRQRLMSALALGDDPVWLQQVHGTQVLTIEDSISMSGEYDASVTRQQGVACAILTADCLPLLFCNRQGTVVAAAHAGWRGLAAGVIRNTVAAMKVNPADLLVYLGPAISQSAFEVGSEVAEAFADNAINADHRGNQASCFIPSENKGALMADLFGLARVELAALGVSAVFGGDYCTYRDRQRFYSYRRDGVTGRMASLIWLAGES